MSPALAGGLFTTEPPRKQVLPNPSGYANSQGGPQAHQSGGQQQPHGTSWVEQATYPPSGPGPQPLHKAQPHTNRARGQPFLLVPHSSQLIPA